MRGTESPPNETPIGSGASPLDARSLHMRRLVFRAVAAADKGHVGAALSLIEIFRVLYESVARHDPKRPTWGKRDRVVLSKGHGCLALFAALADQGYFPLSELETFCELGSPLGGHPERHLPIGIEASTGALGHGFPLAVGIALAHQRKRDGVRVFVVVGDGELNEGSNWEAMLLASKHKLANLTMIVDHNGDQLHGPVADVMPLEPLRGKLEQFGGLVIEADGHDMRALRSAFEKVSFRTSGPPGVIIAHTIKGKGIRQAERNPLWHYLYTFSDPDREMVSTELAGVTTQSALSSDGDEARRT